MKTTIRLGALLALAVLSACGGKAPESAVPAPGPPADLDLTADPAAYWNSATIYFLLTDRFRNGDQQERNRQIRAFGLLEASKLCLHSIEQVTSISFRDDTLRQLHDLLM